MPIPFLAQLGVAAAPSLINAGANLLRRDKPSPYERELSGLADIFKSDATSPITENQLFKSGQSQLDARDEKNRRVINDNSAATGATDEAKLANIQGSNEVYNHALQNLLARAAQYRQRARSNYMNVLGAQESARQGRNQQFQQNLAGITGPLSQAGNAFLLSDVFANSPSGTGAQGTDTSGMQDVANLFRNRTTNDVQSGLNSIFS